MVLGTHKHYLRCLPEKPHDEEAERNPERQQYNCNTENSYDHEQYHRHERQDKSEDTAKQARDQT